MRPRLIHLLFGCSFLAFSMSVMGVVDQPSMVALAGGWRGGGEITVSWTAQRQLAVDLTIAPDGAVHGTVGDARLVNGRLMRNRTWLGRALNIKTDYIILGRLEGCIVASEKVCRNSVKIPLNWSDGGFAGSLHTSGKLRGGRERMVFTVARLRLVRG